ncbi:Uncharacterized protein APZ42_018857 [Daphnia magna]|uniref:Uncharacterized protein n=2 Tax=Daphnia magna TaxID=35525 RepID=A0A0P5Y3N7_9CRUS|nr:Uncharacterized protein APZ42_018857 [Daphnia magna]
MIGKIRSCPCRLLEARHFSGGNRPKRKMHSFIFALFASIVVVHVSAQYRPYYDDNLYPHPSYPLSDGRSPNVAYDHRLFFSYLTSTTTTTTTTTTTCTVLTALACVGRRRRSFLQNDDDPIEPSAVNKVEVTPLAEVDFTSRVERKAAPQLAYWRGGIDYPSYQPLSTFGQRPFAAVYNPYVRRPVIAADPRFLLYYGFTTTTTSTTTATSRSTPICSQPSGFNQC